MLAQAEVAKDRRTITYTFTDYVNDYTPKDMELYLQLYPNRYKLVSSDRLTLNANIGNSSYEKSIDIDYRTAKGYQDPNIDVSSYMLRLEPETKTFTTIIYYNQWNRKLTNKGIEFILDKNVDKKSLEVTTYKRLNNKNQAIEGSHSTGYQTGDLPDSYGINPSVDKLQEVGKNFTLQSKYYQGIFGTSGKMDTITLPYGYLNKGYYVDQKIDNTVNKDPMDTSYVIEIKGKLTGNDVKSLKTQVQYNHKINWYTSGYDNYGYWRNNLLVGRYYAGAFKTWSQFYTPGASGNASKEMQVINFRNRIDFVKVDGGVKGEVPNTIPDENGKTQESSIFANDTIGEALAGAEFKLKKDGSQDFIEDSKTTSDERGRFSWVALAKGSYEVWETNAPEGYKLPKDKVASFTVNDKGQITLDNTFKEVIANKKVSKIKIRKVDQDGNPIAGKTEDGTKTDTQAGFSLVGANGEKVKGWNNLTKYTDKDGYAYFEDIPTGNFELKETETPKGYTNSGKTWKLTVAKDGRMAWTNSFDDSNDILKQASYTENATATTNLATKIVGIDKTKKVFRQYNIIKANKDDLKDKKITISSPDNSIKLNQDNTKVRLVALDGKSKIDNPTPIKDEADYQVTYNNSSMEVSIKLPEEKNAHNPVGGAPGEGNNKQKTYLLIVDLPYSENSKVGAKISYNNENVETTVDEESIKQEENDQSLESFKNFYRPTLVNDLDFVVENIKKPDIYFKKVDEDTNKELEGGEFEIRRKKEDGEEYLPLDPEGKAIQSPTAQTELWTARSDSNGHFEFKYIPDGEYQIVETKAPKGYALVQKIVFKFVVKNGKINYIDDKENNIPKNGLKFEYENTKGKVNSKDNRILITNKKAEYPHTGGPGVWIGFTILGLILMFIAVLTYSKRRDTLVL